MILCKLVVYKQSCNKTVSYVIKNFSLFYVVLFRAEISVCRRDVAQLRRQESAVMARYLLKEGEFRELVCHLNVSLLMKVYSFYQF